MTQKLIRSKNKKKGLPPGALVYVGKNKENPVSIDVFEYNEENYIEKKGVLIEECFSPIQENSVRWININGVHDTAVIEKIGAFFQIHSLVLEDILNTDQRPKVEEYENFIFIILKMIYHYKKAMRIEQVGLILGKNFVLSFQEEEGDVFDPIRERIRQNKGKVRKMKADYLAYALLDSIVDNYFPVLENMGERIEETEDEVIHQFKKETVREIYRLRREIIFFRKSIWPLREVTSTLERTDSNLLSESFFLYLKDIRDHIIEGIDHLDSFRDMLASLFDIYLSSLSNKMNEVMKFLAIISTIFIPLTFLAGIYGMNLKMPEVQFEWFYPQFFWGIILLVVLIMVLFFKKKKWF
ncbi:MAG TPA: magnesium and cobalt transport protein CorA [Spirochaetia bacterium]|nr:MAG: magnesium and cobalt transport protein CorA [Spirochaetes bacterium GWB1_36_13]HCL56483.1 magnesium and cobalt transport protein CorA [Spirochaetia bacterium]